LSQLTLAPAQVGEMDVMDDQKTPGLTGRVSDAHAMAMNIGGNPKRAPGREAIE